MTLNVKNTFNSLRRSDVLNDLEYKHIVPHYILAILSSYLTKSSGPRVKHII